MPQAVEGQDRQQARPSSFGASNIWQPSGSWWRLPRTTCPGRSAWLSMNWHEITKPPLLLDGDARGVGRRGGKKTRQGVRAVWPTRPAGLPLHLAEPLARHRTTTWTLHPGTLRRKKCLRILARQGTRRTEADIVVQVRRHIPVTVGGADIHRLIVERAATQHTATRSSPSEN
jgi:hypothetical protein